MTAGASVDSLSVNVRSQAGISLGGDVRLVGTNTDSNGHDESQLPLSVQAGLKGDVVGGTVEKPWILQLQPTVEMTLDASGEKAAFVRQCSDPLEAGAEPQHLDWDNDREKPTLLATRGLAIALQYNARQCQDPHHAMLCYAIYQHLKATDPVVADLPINSIISETARRALEAFPSMGDFKDLWVNSAKSQLASILPSYKPHMVSLGPFDDEDDNSDNIDDD
ncbi:hypothetical protein ABBQ38_012365 [Trebouxia sp. C0009 RCD-2024]